MPQSFARGVKRTGSVKGGGHSRIEARFFQFRLFCSLDPSVNGLTVDAALATTLMIALVPAQAAIARLRSASDKRRRRIAPHQSQPRVQAAMSLISRCGDLEKTWSFIRPGCPR
ncbi:Hypothetical protein GbCGDNIH7_8203 [Granulibacter bethesdensis]|nr:Hypothetical protein GbCGDNIH7_8203 [Granulibacter bethesdensis]